MVKQQRIERQAETRQKLIAAASRVFAAHGYAGARVELIAEEAGFSKGAFYSNFISKEEVALAVLERLLADDGWGVWAILESHDGNTESLFRRLAEDFAIRHSDEPVRALRIELLMHAWRDARFRVRAAELYQQRRQRYAELVAQGLGLIGRVPGANVMAIADTLLAVDHGHSTLTLAGAEPTPVSEVVLLLLRGLAAMMPPVSNSLCGHDGLT